jgi:CPA1 family monovalent cation:H+ antiporter
VRPDGSLPNESSSNLTIEGLLLDTIRHEREDLNFLRVTGRIGDGIHRSLERELDLSERPAGIEHIQVVQRRLLGAWP